MTLGIRESELQQAIESDFTCHRCGHCCKGDGLVHFGREEAEAMARVLGMAVAEFLADYAVAAGRARWRLRDKWITAPLPMRRDEQWCVFLERDEAGMYGCRVHEAKPRQCEGFPFAWRNPDSHQTCVGLRALIDRLRKTAA